MIDDVGLDYECRWFGPIYDLGYRRAGLAGSVIFDTVSN